MVYWGSFMWSGLLGPQTSWEQAAGGSCSGLEHCPASTVQRGFPQEVGPMGQGHITDMLSSIRGEVADHAVGAAGEGLEVEPIEAPDNTGGHRWRAPWQVSRRKY